MLWSKEYKELVSSHGFAQNQLVIWKYPSMNKVAELTGELILLKYEVNSLEGLYTPSQIKKKLKYG